MAERYLIDTCAVIKYLNSVFPPNGVTFLDAVVDNESMISFISEIELQVWNPADPADLDVFVNFVNDSDVIGIEPNIIAQTIDIRKNYKLKVPDAIIAATALINGFTLISDNDSDFKKVPHLKYINPMSMV